MAVLGSLDAQLAQHLAGERLDIGVTQLLELRDADEQRVPSIDGAARLDIGRFPNRNTELIFRDPALRQRFTPRDLHRGTAGRI